MYKIVDLFAGAGGMSLGFTQQGQFRVVAAIENNHNALKTFKRNHIDAEIIYESDIVGLDIGKFKEQVGDVSVVVGGPPCQGFSNANRQRNTLISGNNLLVKIFAEVVGIISPPVFVMENVATLQSPKHKFFVTNADNGIISRLGIKPHNESIVLCNHNPYGQELISLLHDQEAVAALLFDDKIFSALKLVTRCNDTNKLSSYFVRKSKSVLEYVKTYTAECAGESIGALIHYYVQEIQTAFSEKQMSDEGKFAVERFVEFQKALRLMRELRTNDIFLTSVQQDGEKIIASVQAYSVYDYLEKFFEKQNYTLLPNTINAVNFGVSQERKRFVLVGVKKNLCINPGGSSFTIQQDNSGRKTVFDAIGDLYDIEPFYEVTEEYIVNKKHSTEKKAFNDSEKIYNHIATRTTATSLEMFKALEQGQNFHDLPENLKSSYSNTDRTQNTIYMRLSETEPSGTVVNVRKSMWIHPKKARAISIREAARLQSFPDSYVFCGTKDSQYQQVGNAVPPLMAKAIAQAVANLLFLAKHNETSQPSTTSL